MSAMVPIVRVAKRVMPEPVKEPLRHVIKAAHRLLKPYKWPFRILHDARGGSAEAAALALARVVLWPRRRILCYPRSPSRHQIAYRLFLLLGYKMVEGPRGRYDAILVFDPDTVPARHDLSGLRPVGAINAGVRDVSKRNVEARFEEAFGYALSVDPERYHGLAVRKSDENYTHDGVIVECPHVPPPDEEGMTYQRYIDTRTPDGFFEDLRVPIYDGVIPLVYRKFHPDTDRRFYDVDRSTLVATDEALSADEQQRLAALASALGVDYAELDVLRDNGDGRIYVVDVNPTPAGLVKGFTKRQRQQALRALAPAFERMVERRAAATQSAAPT